MEQIEQVLQIMLGRSLLVLLEMPPRLLPRNIREWLHRGLYAPSNRPLREGFILLISFLHNDLLPVLPENVEHLQ